MVINCKKGVLMAFVTSSAAAISSADSFPADHRAHGAQSLLSVKPPQRHYTAQGVALALYALLIGAALTTAFKPAQVVTEEEQTVELAPMPVDEEPPPPPDQAPIEQPEVDDTPPPPMALDPIAPIEEVKPAPKPVEKVEKKVSTSRSSGNRRPRRGPFPPRARPRRRPARRFRRSPTISTPACSARPPTPIRNRKRRARRIFPITRRSGASGSLTSYSISGSGNAAFDAVAQRLGARCGSVPAPGKPVSLSGSLTFSP